MTNKAPLLGSSDSTPITALIGPFTSGQIEAYKNHVDDRSMKFGGTNVFVLTTVT
jgi:hypothetical protein